MLFISVVGASSAVRLLFVIDPSARLRTLAND